MSSPPRHVMNTPAARAAGDDPHTVEAEQQDTTYLSHAIEAFRKEFFDVTGDRLSGTVVRRALRASEPFIATHYEQKGAEGERQRLLTILSEAIEGERELRNKALNDRDGKLIHGSSLSALATVRAALSEKETDQPSGERSSRARHFFGSLNRSPPASSRRIRSLTEVPCSSARRTSSASISGGMRISLFFISATCQRIARVICCAQRKNRARDAPTSSPPTQGVVSYEQQQRPSE
jgi:hypothetical protein